MSACLFNKWGTLTRTEICQFDDSISWDQNILRFDISMKYIPFMNKRSSFENIVTYWPYFVKVKKTFLVFVELIEIGIHKLEN